MPQNPAADNDAVASETHTRIELRHPLLKPKRMGARRETEYEVHVFVKDDPFVGTGPTLKSIAMMFLYGPRRK